MLDTANLASAVSSEEIDHYREHGFAVLRNVIPLSLLDHGSSIIEPWIDYWANAWNYSADEVCGTDFGRRFLLAWEAAGRPHFRRTPNKFLINPSMYRFLRDETLLAIAAAILNTTEISVHGIFNARPQLPRCPNTMTPFHQDAQYWRLDYGAKPDLIGQTHVVTIWIPLVNVDERSGALGVISLRDIGATMIEPHDYNFESTGFIGLAPELVAKHSVIPINMEPGDALIFTQLTPHGALPNVSDHVRWSIDIRYEATAGATAGGQKFGFIAQSLTDPTAVTSLDDWIKKRQR